MDVTKDDIKLFKSLVDNKDKSRDECWVWKGGLNNDKYGIFRWRGMRLYAHVFAYFFARGREYDRRIIIERQCRSDVVCVNPSHYTSMGRVLGGGKKLTIDKILKMKYDYITVNERLISLGKEFGIDLSGVPIIRPLAEKYGISKQWAYDIIRETKYKGIG